MPELPGEFVVLRDHIERADFVRVAGNQGWVHRRTDAGDGVTEPLDEIWATPDERNAIHYVEDPITATRFVWVWGQDLDDLLFTVLRNLPAFEPEELIQDAAEAEGHDEIVETLFRIAVTFPNFDPTALAVFDEFLHHPAPLIRQAAIQSLGYRLWDESLPQLDRAAREDDDEQVRQFASQILRDAEQRE